MCCRCITELRPGQLKRNSEKCFHCEVSSLFYAVHDYSDSMWETLQPMTSPPHNSGQRQAGRQAAVESRRDGWARLWWRSGGWREACMTITEHCILSLVFPLLTYSLSPRSFLSVDDVISLLSQTSSELRRKGRGEEGEGCFLFSEQKEGGGRELSREQRRQGTSPMCMINSWAMGAAMMSEGQLYQSQ